MTRVRIFFYRLKFFATFFPCFFLAVFSSQKSFSLELKNVNRNHISIVGSSTLYPFVAIIAEKFGHRYENFKTPIVEATGTGGGFKLFCGGIGNKFPDFSNASRKIQEKEIEQCQKNGINAKEIKIGYDGIVLANSRLGADLNLTKTQIFFALAKKIPQNGKLVDNFYKKWSQIDKNLPNIEIRIYGPPPSSGTRDAFAELVLEEFCVENDVFKKEFADKKNRAKKCHEIRSDGHFIEAGENDNLILQKLRNDKNAFGIFGFSFLSENENLIKAAKINDIYPNFQNIANSKYSISRPLFIYYKQEHIAKISGVKEFVQFILNPDILGKDGYLAQKGLISLSDLEFKQTRNRVFKNLNGF